MPRSEYERLKAMLQAVLEWAPVEYGRSSGFVQRASKVTAAMFVQILVLGCWRGRETKLADLAQVARTLGVRVTLPGLHQRLTTAAVTLLRCVLQAAVAQAQTGTAATGNSVSCGIFQRFRHVYLQDSTYVSLPAALAEQLAGSGGDASPAGVKVMLNYEYQTGTLAAVEVVPGRTPDSRCSQAMQLATPGSLHLFDLGFYALSLLAWLQAAGSYFLCRHHAQTALFSADGCGQRLELLPLLRRQSTHAAAAAVWEFPALLGASTRLPVRIIVVRLPQSVVAARRRRLHRDAQRRGQTPTATTLALLEWNLFYTNVPTDWWTAAQAAAAYRCRWQIELLFKLCKSQAGLNCIGDWRANRVLCFFYARLIALLLTHRLMAPLRFPDQRELSPAKAFHLLQHVVGHWPAIIARRWRGLRPALAAFADACADLALKDKRVSQPSTYQLLRELGA